MLQPRNEAHSVDLLGRVECGEGQKMEDEPSARSFGGRHVASHDSCEALAPKVRQASACILGTQESCADFVDVEWVLPR